jgi:hypothetical protein
MSPGNVTMTNIGDARPSFRDMHREVSLALVSVESGRPGYKSPAPIAQLSKTFVLVAAAWVINDFTVVRDPSNSWLKAVIPAFDILAAFPVRRRFAALGSIKELGLDGAGYYREVGAYAAGVSLLVTVGVGANGHLSPAAKARDRSRVTPA